MELPVFAQPVKLAHDVSGHRLVVDVLLIKLLGQIVLHAVLRLAILRVGVYHRHFVHELIIHLHGLFVILYLFDAMHLQPCKSGLLSQLVVIVGVHPVGVKAQHIAVGNTVGNRVFVQHVTKDGACCDFVVRVLFKHWRTSEAEEQRPWEGVFDAHEHFAKH